MTDRDLVQKRLALIESLVREIRDLADPADIERDVRVERFVEHSLQMAIQTALDVGSHIVSDERLGEPGSYREVFETLVRRAWLPEALLEPLRAMVGLRNLLVHGYQKVSPAIVRGVVETNLDDLIAFCEAIRGRI